MSGLFNKIFPNLNAPEYMPSSEVILSSLIWYELPKKLEPITLDGIDFSRHVAFTFNDKNNTERNPFDGTSHIRNKHITKNWINTLTRPIYGDAAGDLFDEWHETLREISDQKNYPLNVNENDVEQFSEAVFDSLKGIEAPQSTGISAIPFSIATALLQDKHGGINKAGPFNINEQINKIFLFGNNKHTPERASELIFNSLNQPFKEEMLNIVSQSILKGLRPINSMEIDAENLQPDGKEIDPDLIKPRWLANLQNRDKDIDSSNPFLWFHDSWVRLCSEDNAYRDKLSARRYSDWVTAVARTGLVFSYLWCDLLFITIVNGLKRKDESDLIRYRCENINLHSNFKWREPGHKLSDIKIGKKIESMAFEGRRAKDVVEKLCKKMEERNITIENNKDGLEDWLKEAQKILNDESEEQWFKEQIKKDTVGGLRNKNFYYKYSIRCRNSIGDHADLYYVAFMQSNLTYIDPSPEMLVVISQLSKKNVEDSLRLKDVLDSIRLLGISANKNIISSKLEKIGLCSLKEDADEGLEVYNGF